ncbi:MAG: DNA alkylation repair protein [Candidatus Krumholzibacteria bacterium]|nr:DNA alkylation repair protein [Candidatus Krumholzibacteria bacterium]
MTRSKERKGERLRAIVAELESFANPANVVGMARYGIRAENALGISAPQLRGMAKKIGHDHALALDLWASGIHEARNLAGLVDDPVEVTEAQLERWVKDFDSWDICDGVCGNLFDKTPFAYEKAVAWSARPEEFVKRAGFVLMAALAVHDKKAPDGRFRKFLPLIERESADERNFVKKAVNWALRQIGKRNRALHRDAIAAAKRIRKIDSRSARWIAADALRELESDAVRERVNKR